MWRRWGPWLGMALLILLGAASGLQRRPALSKPESGQVGTDVDVGGAPLDSTSYHEHSDLLHRVPRDWMPGGTGDGHLVPALSATSFHTAAIPIPTYPYSRCLQIDHTEIDGCTYPYRRLNWNCYGNPSPTPQEYLLLTLENDYLRVTLLPELGGRVYQMIYKATGHNEFYQNPVIKPTHWGPPEQGWWLAAGGIEWCLPVEEHGYEWGEPWSWTVVTSTAGVTVTVRDTDAPDRLRAAVDLFLPTDRGMLAVTPHLENPTDHDISYKFWVNAALAPGSQNQPTAGLEFIFNADQMSVHSTGDSRLPGSWPTEPSGPDYRFSWPVYDGTDFSRVGNWHEWLGFFEYPKAEGDFVGVYSHDEGEGVARVFPSEVAEGAKGFAFGWSNPIDWHQWTDDGSGAVELHGGVAPTFWDAAVLAAGATLSWTEYWYPVGSIGTISAATTEAALGARLNGGSFEIGVHSTADRAAGETALYVWDRASCAELAHWELPATGPGNPLVHSVPSKGRSLEQVAIAYVDGEGNVLAALNRVDHLAPEAQVEPLTPWVETELFTVTWSAEDNCTGVDTYDVQVREGYEGTWTDWLTGTTNASGAFSGTSPHTYFFRARARDPVGNQGAFTDEDWGQAFTSVLTEPAPVLVTSRKAAASSIPGTASGTAWFRPGEVVSYTLLVSNTGSLTAAAALTDTPPTEMVVLTETVSATSGSKPTYADGTIRWAGEIASGSQMCVTYVLSPTAETPFGAPLTNTVEISGSALGPLTRQHAAVQVHRVWLPLVARHWGP